MLLHAQTARAKKKHGATIFPATSLVVVCAVSLVFAVVVSVGGWRQGDGRVTVPIGTVWALFSLWLWPTTIILDQTGVTAKHIWRRTRQIPYSEIEYVSRMSNREALIYGTHDREIPVSEYHVAADELESELTKRGVKFYRQTPVPLGGGIR
jgi:hypothetical protein